MSLLRHESQSVVRQRVSLSIQELRQQLDDVVHRGTKEVTNTSLCKQAAWLPANTPLCRMNMRGHQQQHILSTNNGNNEHSVDNENRRRRTTTSPELNDGDLFSV